MIKGGAGLYAKKDKPSKGSGGQEGAPLNLRRFAPYAPPLPPPSNKGKRPDRVNDDGFLGNSRIAVIDDDGIGPYTSRFAGDYTVPLYSDALPLPQIVYMRCGSRFSRR